MIRMAYTGKFWIVEIERIDEEALRIVDKARPTNSTMEVARNGIKVAIKDPKEATEFYLDVKRLLGGGRNGQVAKHRV